MKMKFKQTHTEPKSDIVDIVYLDADLELADKEDATMVKITYKSGEIVYGVKDE